MQTFLPYPSYALSAGVLDTPRLQKQVVETYQIVLQLLNLRPVHSIGQDGVELRSGPTLGFAYRNGRYRSHTAVQMWDHHVMALLTYQETCAFELLQRPKRDGRDRKIDVLYLTIWAIQTAQRSGQELGWTLPRWLGDDAVHASHRSNLLRKDPDYYSRFGWSEPATLPYVWPRRSTQ